ncbi:hypothetical protein OF83DRAFT_352828 [Amylostereum chailletii]|nr:hypothetical protein OF83DRAFT_352828 [Amylostereum chailletii]
MILVSPRVCPDACSCSRPSRHCNQYKVSAHFFLTMPLNLQDDPRDCCNYCSKAAGKASLRKCSACKMVRYCSQECQRAAWKNHKASCKLNETLLANLSLNPASENLNNQLTRWLTVWKPFIYQIGPIAFDLANHSTWPTILRTACQRIVCSLRSRKDPSRLVLHSSSG